jgi:hypothetical protein
LSFGEAGICSGVDGIENHHSFTHHGGMVNRIKGLEKIDTLVLKGVRGFLEGLKEKNLYDDTVVLFHCGMADAMKHSNRDTPTYLFGGGFNHKTQIECMNGDEQKYSIASLFASVMKQCGVRKPDFNGTTKVIPELFTGA